jgi:nitroreductase
MDPMMTPDVLNTLLSRYSLGVKHLAEPGPSDDELRLMADVALRGPDHGELVPWRLVVVRGEARTRLADLFAEHAQHKGKDAEGVAIERERALRAPVTVAVLARIDLGHPQVPAHEQWMCVGGAVANFLNALHAMGYAGKMLSGDKARAAHIAQAFCEPGETLVGWMAIGTPTRALSTNGHKTTDVLRYWPSQHG